MSISTKELDIRNLFIGCVVTGMILIFISQFLNSMIITVGLPTLVMGFYIFIGLKNEAVKPIIEQFADSVYYMGFLFTLVALIVSMLTFGEEQIQISQLIYNFSLALITTIIGLATRITLVNFQADERSTRRQIREELRSTASELISQSRQISTRLEVLNTEIHDTITKSLDESKASIKKSAQSIDEYTHISKEALRKQLDNINESIVDAMNELNNRIRDIDIPPDVISNKLAEPVSLFAEKMHETGVILNQLSDQQKSIRDSSHRIVKSLDRATLKIDNLHQSLDQFNTSIEADYQSRQQLAHLTEANLRNISTVITDVKNGVQHFSEITTQLDNANQKLSVFSDAISGQTQSVSETGSFLKSNLETFKIHQKELEEVVSAARKSLADVSQHLVQAIDYITDRLGK